MLLGSKFQKKNSSKITANVTIKTGGTRPPPNTNSMASLLLTPFSSSGNPKAGIGNAVMGGKFKSIYLA